MYVHEAEDDLRAMREAVGVASEAELFDVIPDAMKLDRELRIPGPFTEIELDRQIRRLAARNTATTEALCFLGAGAYDHFIPAAVDAIASRSEFYTSYTPYQPEVSQGNLQAMFEYQTLMCQLTGMDVSNASLYDGASATIEAVLMAMSITRREKRVVMLRSVHPEYRQVARTYLRPHATEVVEVPFDPKGRCDLEAFAEAIDEETACVVVQHPNFFGVLEPMASIVQTAHDRGALVVQVFDPISLGWLRRPGQWDVDIAVAEGQPLGIPLQYGGPFLGILTCRQAYLRRLPGRIAGETVDRHGQRCYVLTLQTREQHIRREKATSNICTNQGLLALRAAVYLALVGPAGLREIGQQCVVRSRYAAERLTDVDRFDLGFPEPFFKEFVVRDRDGDVDRLLAHAAREGILAGVPLGRWYPELADAFLVAVTERRSRKEIDRWCDVLTGG